MKKGFTLIEMLIVVTIIAVLSSIFLVGLQQFRAPAYDSRRISNLQAMQGYLELYHTRKAYYPDIADGVGWYSNPPHVCSAGSLCEKIKDATGITSIPNDPLPGQNYMYCVSNDTYSGGKGQHYLLGANLSVNDHPVLSEPFNRKDIPERSGFNCTAPEVDCNDDPANETANGLCILF